MDCQSSHTDYNLINEEAQWNEYIHIFIAIYAFAIICSCAFLHIELHF